MNKNAIVHVAVGVLLNDKREDQGVEFFNRYRVELGRAEREFGVPAEIIVAII